MLARSYRRSKIVSLKKRQSNTNIAAYFRINSKNLSTCENFRNYFLAFFKII